jgi:D-3-phosphoglycerate dehydrogenase
MPHVLIAGKIHPDGYSVLRQRSGVTIEDMSDLSADAFMARLPDADALLIRTAPLPTAAIERAHKLRIVSRHGVGYDNVPLPALTAKGIPCAVVGNAGSVAVAEYTLMLMLALSKRAVSFDAGVRSNDWLIRNRLNSGDLENRTLLILGLGRIGREVVKRAAAFDMRILGYDPALSATEIAELGVVAVGDWRAALPGADFVSLHVPRSPATEHMIGARELATMKPTAFLINVARGGLVDEPALAEALAAGRIAGAGIDVLEDEPPPPDHPLLSADRAILSPHIAGLSENAAIRLSVASAMNVLAALDGTLDPNLVVNAEVLKR